uniref:Uncharacterized protein n=1 Tax=Otus sunia TaxID=257818 RepID=A0A8C8A835_9STRI
MASLAVVVWTLPVALPGAAAQQARRVLRPHHGAGFLPAGPKLGDAGRPYRFNDPLRGFQEPLRGVLARAVWVLRPPNPADEVGSLGQPPQVHTCPFWQHRAKS